MQTARNPWRDFLLLHLNYRASSSQVLTKPVSCPSPYPSKMLLQYRFFFSHCFCPVIPSFAFIHWFTPFLHHIRCKHLALASKALSQPVPVHLSLLMTQDRLTSLPVIPAFIACSVNFQTRFSCLLPCCPSDMARALWKHMKGHFVVLFQVPR